MTKYAIVKIVGQQYKVSEGMLLNVSRLPNKEGESIDLTEVLLFKDGENVQVGSPYLSNVKVKANILKNFKGEKIDVYKFKAKVRYRRHIGFRPLQTQLKIEKIESGLKDENHPNSPSTKKQRKENIPPR